MWKAELVAELSSAVNGERARVIDKYQKLTGKSAQTLYRIAGANGYQPARKKRVDTGTCQLTDHQISFISGMVQTSAREVKGCIMDVETALSIAEDNHIIQSGCISVPRMTAILREREMNAAALDTATPHINMRSLHPNHVHVWDMSVCIQYYLKKGGGFGVMREDAFYKNKWENFAKVKEKLIRYILVDHFSHAIFLKYYYTGGETQENLYDFLTCAWGMKDEKFPFRGVPFYALMDKGAANTSLAMIEFLKRLDIKFPDSLPHNPRRQGSAEVAQNLVESKFESRLRFQPAHAVADLNQWAHDWCIYYNGCKKHSRHGMTRSECWLSITKDQLRELPEKEILHYLFAKPGEERKVKGNYTISFSYKTGISEEFSIKHIPGIIPNKSIVTVILRPYNWPEIGIQYRGEEYIASPIGRVAGGFAANAAVIGEEFKAQPETLTQQSRKIVENMAFGENRKKDQAPFEGLTVFGIHGDKVNRTYIPRAGTPVDIGGGDVSDRMISITDFFKRLIREAGSITPAANAAIRERYGSSIPLSESNRLIDAVQSGQDIISAVNEYTGGNDVPLKAVAT